jgi:nucleoside-diphosphate-sugar epimerase
MDGARSLVAGGGGFVGSSLVRRLLDAGSEVTVVDDFFSGSFENLAGVSDEVSVVAADVLDRTALDAVFERYRPSHVFHLIGDTFVPSADHHPARFLRINVEATLRMLEAVRDHGAERMVYVSSTEVYGDVEGPIDETAPLDPVNTYAVTKLAADRLCHTFNAEHDVPVVVARIFNCYGPRETQPYVVPEIIRQLAAGPVVRLGNTEAARDFTYVDDTARALIALMTSDRPDGSATNIGTGRPVGLREIASLCAAEMGQDDPTIERDPRRERRRDIDVFHADPSRLVESTGWAPLIGLEEGLRRTIEWFRGNGSRWLWEDWCPDGIIGDPRRLSAARDTTS